MGTALLALIALSVAAAAVAVYMQYQADNAPTDEERAKQITDALMLRLLEGSKVAVLAG